MLTTLHAVCQALQEAHGSKKFPLAAKFKGKVERALAKLEKLALPGLLDPLLGHLAASSQPLKVNLSVLCYSSTSSGFEAEVS